MDKKPPRHIAYPTGDHRVSPSLEAFFSRVSEERPLQEKLYHTKNIAEVAAIAKEAGYHVTPAEILQAQAARILNLTQDDLEILAAADKPKSGAQWGRDGRGYLDLAGPWLLQFMRWGLIQPAPEQPISDFYDRVANDPTLQSELGEAKSHDDIARIAKSSGFGFTGIELVQFHARQILRLSEERADRVARGALDKGRE